MNKSTIKHKRFQGITVLFLFICVLCSQNNVALAKNLRCNGRIVSVGDTKAEVLEMCDEPNKREQWEEGGRGTIVQVYDYKTERYIAPKRLESPIQMERWTYNLGSNMFIRYLIFQNGELIKIETGEKGSN